MLILQIRELTVVARIDDATVPAVRELSFDLAPGRIIGLVGESGAGKSMVGRAIAQMLPPGFAIAAGSMSFEGRDLIRMAPRRAAMQMVFQDTQSALNPRRRVMSIVTQAMEAASPHAIPAERRARTQALLAEVGLPGDLAERLPAQLSGGQRQRINIARALCIVPKLLIADEIVSGLDVSIQAQLLNLLTRLRSELGFAMLFISHDLSVVRHLCSRVLVMYRGEIVEQGSIDTVFADPRHPHTRSLLASVPPDDADSG